MAHSSSSTNWVYDVFPSFSGEDIRKNFLSHFLKELDRKLIIAFKDNEIERSRSLDPELKQAIKDSRIAVVVFSKNYASSSWCLNELLEIVRHKQETGQLVIPIFYRLDPSHVRKQTGDFGKAFEKTCKNRTEEVKSQWQKALTDVANILGYHCQDCDSEATMIETIVNDVLGKLKITPSNDFKDCVGLEDHIKEMSLLLDLESEEVRMVGIWGAAGIGKTTIARALFSRLSRHFQGSVFIDRAFVSRSMETYSLSNPNDYNMKLHLQEKFLSKLLDKVCIEVDHLGVVREKLMHGKVLIIIDDLSDQVVLDVLVGEPHWFGSGSRIIVVTEDKHFLRAHGIDCVYEVGLPSKKLALQMFCRSAFKKDSPPDGLMELASEVALLAGNLPLGLDVLGSYLRGRDKEDWEDSLPRLRNGLDGKIEKTLKLSYDGLKNKKDEEIFRHVACYFNGEKVNDIELLLADSDLDVNIGLKNLVDKSLIQERDDVVEMHCLLQKMGKEIVHTQSNEPGEREFLVDTKDVCDVLEDSIGTKKVIGISLDLAEVDQLRIHKEAFKGMRNIRFLRIYTKEWDQKKELYLPEDFDYFPPKLRLLRFDGYPMRCMPFNFCPVNLVKLQMQRSKLEKLWDGVHSLTGHRIMDLRRSINLKEIPDLSMALNLEKLHLNYCLSLVELPSSIQYLNKLKHLDMSFCENLETLPTGINLRSLDHLNLTAFSRLRSFPDISTNICELHVTKAGIDVFSSNLHLENLAHLSMCEMKSAKLWERVQPLAPLMTMLSSSLTTMWLSHIPSLVELPSSIQHFNKLGMLRITECKNLETLPTGVNLESLVFLDFSGCSRLRTFPDISRNIFDLELRQTGIEEVPWWIEDFSRLQYLRMESCSKLEYVYLNVSKINHPLFLNFSHCGALTGAELTDYPSEVAMEADDNVETELPYFPMVFINFTNCLNLDQDAILQQRRDFLELILSCEEVPSYFTHRTTGTSMAIPLHQSSLSQQPSFSFEACAMVESESLIVGHPSFEIQLSCRFKDRFGNIFESFDQAHSFWPTQKDRHLLVFNYVIPIRKGNAPLAEWNYDHVEIQTHITNSSDSAFKLKGWGIRFFEDCSSPENRFGNPNTLPHVCEADEENMLNEYEYTYNETEQGEEYVGSDAETERSSKRLRVSMK